MIDYLPLFMRKNKTFQEIFNAEGEQIDLLLSNIKDLNNQLTVDTATWGLIIFEKELKIKTDLNKPLSERRSVIKSKLRGSGKVDHIQIKLVADAFTNGDVLVTFNGHIVIRFTSTLGVPTNVEDLKNAIDEIKPAHLAVDYEYRYVTYDMLKGKYGTYEVLKQSGLTYEQILVN